jgi:hypothetical protein
MASKASGRQAKARWVDGDPALVAGEESDKAARA